MDNSTQQGIAALKAGNKPVARTLFRKAIQQNHEDVQAWLGLSAAVESDFEKVQCLQTIMKIDPTNKIAKKALDQIVGRLFHGDTLNLDNPNLGSTIGPFSETPDINPNQIATTANKQPASAANEKPFATQGAFDTDPFELLRSKYALTDNSDSSEEKNQGGAAAEAKSQLPFVEKKIDPTLPSYLDPEQVQETPLEEEKPQAEPVKKKSNLRMIIISASVLAVIILGTTILALTMVLKSGEATPTPEFMAVAKPINVAELTLTATVNFKPPTPTIEVTPTVKPTRTQAPTATFPVPNRTVQARFKEIQAQVADLRGLTIKSDDVPVYPVTKPQAEDYFKKEISSAEFAQNLENRKKALVMLGLVNPSFDMLGEVINHSVDGVGGFYMPKSNEIFIVTGFGMGGQEYVTYSHEFDHALVDQHYDIDKAGKDCPYDSQHCAAIDAVVEGDAELLMEQWVKQYITEKDILQIVNSPQVFYTPSTQAIPPYLAQDALFPYYYGKQFVYSFFQTGNWAAVNKVYDRLPESTSQIMHPDKYNLNQKPINLPDKAVAEKLGDSWTLVENDVLGEWMTFLMLAYNADKSSQVDQGTAKVASTGWAGDRYQVFENKVDHKMAMSAHWIFDTSPDAGEFNSIMQLVLETRSRGNKLDWKDRNCWSSNDQVSCLFVGNKQVLWLEAPDQDTITAMLPAFSDFVAK